mmetsp:Transcript_3014/g.10063  ORF Transcript_3014/g.10063 Transcript_3014/m.10063 type:complete len:146 (-) Transcript_3014:38-475(-)
MYMSAHTIFRFEEEDDKEDESAGPVPTCAWAAQIRPATPIEILQHEQRYRRLVRRLAADRAAALRRRLPPTFEDENAEHQSIDLQLKRARFAGPPAPPDEAHLHGEFLAAHRRHHVIDVPRFKVAAIVACPVVLAVASASVGCGW